MAVVIDSDHRRWTAADLREIPDDRNRHEIIDGELFVTPSPSPAHQWLSKRFFLAIHSYLDQHGIGEIIYAPADVEIANDTVVEPDLFVVPPIEGKPPRSWEEAGKLLLVIEILSPSTARVDRTVKRRRYQLEGIPEYWIIDGDARIVERWRPEDERPTMITDRLEWKLDARVAPLIIDLPNLFAAALGE